MKNLKTCIIFLMGVIFNERVNNALLEIRLVKWKDKFCFYDPVDCCFIPVAVRKNILVPLKILWSVRESW